MDAVQNISLDIAKFLSGNDIYQTYKDQWRYLLESYLGGMEYQRANHLTRYQLETDAEYSARLRTTPMQNHCASVISVYNSFLFRTEPDRELTGLEFDPMLEEFMDDADLDGRSLNAFMKDVSTWASVFGHAWIIMAKPDIGAASLGDEQAAGVRPYVNLVTPLVVLDWQYSRAPNGRYVLDYLKYIEDNNGSVVTLKEWRPATIRTIIIDEDQNSVNSDVTEPNGLGKIPAICAYNRRSTFRGIGISDIGDIADAQKFIYNATSEIDQSIRLDSHPSLVKTPDTIAGIGAGSLIHMPDNLDPGLKPYILEFSGASVDKILNSINHTIDSIDKMANTGAVRSSVSRTMSGVAMETEFQLLNARLSEKADSMELAEEQMWTLWAEYQGKTWTGTVEYPSSFNLKDTESEIRQLQVAKATATDPAVIRRIDGKVMEWLGYEDDLIETIADERVEYAAEGYEPTQMGNPVNGEQRVAMTFDEYFAFRDNGWVEVQ